VEAITITAIERQIIDHNEGEFSFTLLISHLSSVFVPNKHLKLRQNIV
jgi:hypothetical protein